MRRGERFALGPRCSTGRDVMLRAGLEHFSCSKPAVLCVSRRPPVVSGPEAKVEVLRARVETTR